MTVLSLPQTIFPFPLSPQIRNPSPRSTNPPPRKALTLSNSKEVERGVEFETGGSFFRHESAVGRDLGVLAASLHRRSTGRDIRVLDAMCGCGVRALRYLTQAGAGFVWANDAYEGCRGLILSNLSRVDRVSPGGERRWVVTHSDASRVMAESYLQREFFDLVDVDSFGGDSSFMRSAIAAAKIGGLLYLTSTDGYSSGGHRPQQWSFTRSGVMLKVARGKLDDNKQYGFISYCNRCGNSKAFSWAELGHICCPCSNGVVSKSLVVSGPLWTGPLHKAAYVSEMLKLAGEWGWAYTGEKGVDLENLLNRMIDESDPQLPFGYIKLDEIASRAKINSPPLSTMINNLQKEGYAASRSHIASNAIKTNCPMASCIQIAMELRHS